MTPSPEPAAKIVSWSFSKCVLFRFLCCYLALYLFTEGGLLGFIPGSSAISSAISSGWSKLLPWFAAHVLRLSGPAVSVYKPGGDTQLDYVMYVFLLLTAAIATVAWSLADSKRRNYGTLDSWLRLGVCYHLIYCMLTFGINKVIPLQFAFPNLDELLKPVGFHSLRMLFWSLMGASPGYVMFCGATEILAALLLIFKRTRTLPSVPTSMRQIP